MLIVRQLDGSKQDFSTTSTKEIPPHIKQKIDEVMYRLKLNKDFVRFMLSHSIRYENITIMIKNIMGDLDMIRKSPQEYITVIFDNTISKLLRVSFTDEFLKLSVSKDFQTVESFNTILSEFNEVNVDKLVEQYANIDDLYFIDLSYVHNSIKEKGAVSIGRWIKSQTKEDVCIYLKDEFNNFQNFYDTTKTTMPKTLFDDKDFKPKRSGGYCYLPIFAGSEWFGVCILSESEAFEEIKLELFKMALATLALLIKEF